MKPTASIIVVILALLIPAPEINAQSSASEAIAIARSYIQAHNAHDIEGTMAFYHPEATFQLSFDRGLKSGTTEILALERFDAFAHSAVFPFGLAAYGEDSVWHVTARGVVENSMVFSAMGMKIVIAKPTKPIMQISKGLIIHMEQPPVDQACLKIARDAITGASDWLVENDDLRIHGLTENGVLSLKPHLLPLIADVLRNWRLSSNSQANASDVLKCGTIAQDQLGASSPNTGH